MSCRLAIAATSHLVPNPVLSADHVAHLCDKATPATGYLFHTRYDDAGNLWADLDTSNNVQARYVWGDGVNQLWARYQSAGQPNPGVGWYLSDAQGSVRDLMDNSGALHDHLDFNGYGGIVTETNAAYGDHFQYDAGWKDATTGQELFGQRWYDAATGRWTSQDPLGFAGGDSNLYRYVGNDPTNFSDPSGLAASPTSPDPVGGTTSSVTVYHNGVPTLVDPTQFSIARLHSRAMTDQQISDEELAQNAANAPPPPPVERLNWFDLQLQATVENFDWLTGGRSTSILNNQTLGQAIDVVDQGVAGWADGLTGGLSTRGRSALWGRTAERNHHGAVFQGGRIVGQVHQSLITRNMCNAPTWVQIANGTLRAANVAGGVLEGQDRWQAGDPLGAAMAWGDAGMTAMSLPGTCFAAGTPVRTPDGSRSIEELRPGDLVLSRPEHEFLSPVEPCEVEEVFTRASRLLVIRVRGQEIKTTPEHPFWVPEKGWQPAAHLAKGDLLSTEDSGWAMVEGVVETRQVATVYNMRVGGHHTYFVGRPAWGFAIWVHNAGARGCGGASGAAKAGGTPAKWANSRETGGLKGHAVKHGGVGSIPSKPAAYYNHALTNMRTGTPYRFYHNGQFKTGYVTSVGNGRYVFTSTSLNGKTIFTHMEVGGQYLRNLGITLKGGG